MTRNQIVLEDLVELINEHGGIVRLMPSRRRTLFSMPVTKRPALTALYAM